MKLTRIPAAVFAMWLGLGPSHVAAQQTEREQILDAALRFMRSSLSIERMAVTDTTSVLAGRATEIAAAAGAVHRTDAMTRCERRPPPGISNFCVITADVDAIVNIYQAPKIRGRVATVEVGLIRRQSQEGAPALRGIYEVTLTMGAAGTWIATQVQRRMTP